MKNGIMPYLVFGDWFISLSILFLRSIHVVACSISFLSLKNIPLYQCTIFCLFTDPLMDLQVISFF